MNFLLMWTELKVAPIEVTDGKFGELLETRP
jgi:hypothetical protein